MKPSAFLVVLVAIATTAAYALNRGLYIGSSIYRSPYNRDQVWYDKDCKYLFLSGIRSQQSGGGPTPQAADDNGFCSLFQRQFKFPN